MRRLLLVLFTLIGFLTTGNVPGSTDLSRPDIGRISVTTTALVPRLPSLRAAN